MRHIISIRLQYRIPNVAPTDNPEVSRLTLVTIGSDQVISQINKQLFKLVDVVNIADMTLGDHIERELMLLKLSIPPDDVARVRELASQQNVRILDDSPANYTMELTGTGSQLDDFIDRVGGIAELLAIVRSGPLAMSRGQQVLSATL